ncbi:hypothetical protein PHISCL_02325 [Aspergillus sclerotialis]|uniref:Zn(2)-C6 fungal-type domain-containing protein n=1 Tax=Aspergillus sclerotialis TaxID=2070753 RepID=A0A3A2ZQD9_9EURO|nr:hypothetical protein PHISCL_02325 [Aspergillus sclerotialis]
MFYTNRNSLNCRQRHLKCDRTGTQCLRCQSTGRQCVPAPLRPDGVSFRHGQNPSLRSKGPRRYGETDLTFPEDQVWVDTPSNFTFEDETEQTAADYEVVPVRTPPVLPRRASESQTSTSLVLTPSAPSIRPFSSGDSPWPRHVPSGHVNSSLLPPDSLVERQRLGNFNEALLLRHFGKTLGSWLDVYNTGRHFSVDAVERAPSSSLLLYACLATSARHLSHTTHSVPSEVADGYHERCIAILLPVLENKDFNISIEILLASTVTLRFFEQISSHTPSNDLQRHLLAGSVYISSHTDCAVGGGLAEASFWIFVVQDIQFALANHKPLRLTFRPFDEKLQQLWNTKTDRIWTHKAIWLLAEAINLCYGNEPVDGPALKRKIHYWETEKPDTFWPLHVAPPDPGNGRPFPVIWYTSPSHRIAIQHICMAKALILEHDLQNVSPGFYDARRTKDDMVENLNIVFGIALSTDNDPAASIMACHALCACSSWVRDPLAQSCLLDLLRRTETQTGWPWAYVIQKLSRDWHFRRSVDLGQVFS